MFESENYRYLALYNDIYKKNNDTYRELARRSGMSECAFWIFYSIKISVDGITQKEICEMMYEPKQTVNSAIKKLEQQGYLYLEKEENTRSKRVYLTEKGEQIAEKFAIPVISSEIKAFEMMTEKERMEFLRLSEKYTNILSDISKELFLN